MLKGYDLIKSLFFTLLIVAIVGCGKKTAKPIDVESLPPKFSQVLIVKNNAGDQVHIFPAPGLIGEPLVLKPGESISMNFIVNRKANLDESGNPKENGWVVEIDEQHKFLGMRDSDGLLRIKTPKGELWEYHLVLGRCWFENKPPTKNHELIISENGPDRNGSAVVLCK